MTTAQGLVQVVYPEIHGVVVVADAGATDTALTVADASDLTNYPAGVLQLPDGSLIAYQDTAFGTGTDPDTVNLAADLGVTLTAEQQLALVEYDADGDPVLVTTWWMSVLLDDGSLEEALIPPHKVPTLKAGIRDVGWQERVLCERDDTDQLVFTRVLRRPPAIAGELLVTGNIRLASGAALLDATGSPLMAGDDTGDFPSAVSLLQFQVAGLEAGFGAITGGGQHIDGGVF